MSAAERALFEAYGTSSIAADGAAVIRYEACACGGEIRCRDTEKAIAFAVTLHVRSEQHDAWSKAQGYQR